MGLTSTKTLYKAIALISFIVLIGLLVYLTYNTFVLNDQHYQNTEKLLIKEYYHKSIRNDKLYPGGQEIMDAHLNPHIHLLDSLQEQNSQDLQQLLNSLFHLLIDDLRKKNTMDTVFNNITRLYELGEKWEYALTINGITINGKDGQKIILYKEDKESHKLTNRIRIGGNLQKIKPTNLITDLTVSSSNDYSYDVNFALYADRSDRAWMIFKLVAPLFLFGLGCIAAIIVVYFLTYKNWLRQKKLAEMKSDFVNSITHEFHTPISTILVANKTLQNNPQINNHPTINSISNVIERQSIRLQRLFSQVLDITAMGGYTLEKERVHLRQLLNNIITDYKLTVKDEQVNITFHHNNISSEIELNPFFFTTMLVNLLENAVKHNLKEYKTIEVELVDKGKNLEIIISDNGEGIIDKEIANIFKKFHRSSQSKTEGLGLGLYYVKQCINSHGWSMDLVSEEYVGSRFILSIPQK